MCVCGHVFLNEERTVSTATHKGDKRGVVWFLNTGTTNHMTSLVNTFAELDRSIFGKVRFADGSVVDIQKHRCLLHPGAQEQRREGRPAQRVLVLHRDSPWDAHRA